MQRADQRHPRQHRQAPGHQADAPVAAEAPAQALDGGRVAPETHQRMKAPRLTEQAVEHQGEPHRHRGGKQEENKQGRHGTIGNLLQSTL
jgi:hypothetical protein